MKKIKKRLIAISQQARFLGMLLLEVILLLASFSICASADTPTYQIQVNRQENCITIYKKDKNGNYTVPYKAMACSSGGKNTPLGTFHVPVKYRWRALIENSWGQYATRINGPILFHSVPYRKMDPSTMIEGEFNKLGQNASHGCIRLNVQDAKWIYDNIAVGTTVIIYDDDNPGPLGKPNTITIENNQPQNWDPTDIWSEGNPYLTAMPQIQMSGTLMLHQSEIDSSNVKELAFACLADVTAISSTHEVITDRITLEGLEELALAFDGLKPDSLTNRLTSPGNIVLLTYQVTDTLGRSTLCHRYVKLLP